MINTIFLLTLPLMAFTYDNIALHKNAIQSHPYVNPSFPTAGDASNAVDGLKTNFSFFGQQCIASANNQLEALWRVDLGAILGIHHITIYYRTDNAPWGPRNGYVYKFLGFSVYISNTTNKENGVLCFKDDYFTKYTIPAVITLNCTHHGRYVIYYNNRTSSNLPPDYSQYAYNGLCEFEVYGCPYSKYYGERCNLPCPPTCKNRSCHIEKGYCFGCEDGYLGSTCNFKCDSNTYGPACSMKCGHCFNGEQCHHVNGACFKGCEAGYYNTRCKNECPSKSYGKNCLQTCSEKCYTSRKCDRKTGACDGGCVEGWKPPLCDAECDTFSFGRNCSKPCGHCQNGVPCNKKTGRCPSGCASGFEGIYCNKTCDVGSYGYDCNETCGHCRDVNQCSDINGTCLTGCDADYQGDLCKTGSKRKKAKKVKEHLEKERQLRRTGKAHVERGAGCCYRPP